jgi:CheY-like chemotaxis protein
MIRNMARPDAKTIPIIAMTANAFAEDVQAALDNGMNAHIAKPINERTVMETLAEFIHAE